jgi:hypothetical protein
MDGAAGLLLAVPVTALPVPAWEAQPEKYTNKSVMNGKRDGCFMLFLLLRSVIFTIYLMLILIK